jgi:hypothetical protein
MIKYLFGLMLALAACEGEDFVEEYDLGQVQEGLSAKPSSAYTFGVSTSPSFQKCTVALGAGAGFSCIVPSRTTVRYKMTGTDDFDAVTEAAMSWKANVRRAFNTSIPGYLDQGGYGNPLCSCADFRRSPGSGAPVTGGARGL